MKSISILVSLGLGLTACTIETTEGTSGSGGTVYAPTGGTAAQIASGGAGAGTAGSSASVAAGAGAGGEQSNGGATAGTAAASGGTSAGSPGVTGGTSAGHAGASAGTTAAATGGSAPGGAGAGQAGAGLAGTPGASGGAGGAAGGTVDSCTAGETPTNDTRGTATPYVLESTVNGCVQSNDDIDFYQFTVPSAPAGGYVTVRITDVGTTGTLRAQAWSAADNGQFHELVNGNAGGSLFFYFNAKPGATFRVAIEGYLSISAATPYSLTVNFTPVPDTYEPNDLRTDAKPITVGVPVSAYFFAGWENSTGIPAEDWYDWYSVDLQAASTTVTLAVAAADITGRIVLYNSAGSELQAEVDGTAGSTVELTRAIQDAGQYYLRISPYLSVETRASVVDPAQYLTLPYTLTVTQ